MSLWIAIVFLALAQFAGGMFWYHTIKRMDIHRDQIRTLWKWQFGSTPRD